MTTSLTYVFIIYRLREKNEKFIQQQGKYSHPQITTSILTQIIEKENTL